MTQTPNVVNDITGTNPVPVWAIVTPRDTDEVAEALRRSDGPVSIGGGRFSMGGQCASPKSLHLDMRQMNKVLGFSPSDKTIHVQAGARWRDIQRFIDPHGLSVKVMQSYANFTVGGALAVNCHGRYIGLGPVILSVRAIKLVLADATVIDASRTENSELFFGAIGGYGSVGVITEAELDLADNHRVQRLAAKMSAPQYLRHFKDKIRNDKTAVFHNADLYPPEFTRVRSVTWVETERAPTEPWRLHESDAAYPLHRYLTWAVNDTPLGKWRREYLIDPLVYRRKTVHWRNYEASYDVAELEPATREHATYVLQEYFVPAERFLDFVPKMAEILRRHRVDMVNISVRHAHADPGTLLAWARGETFAFVLYHKQRTRDNAKNRVAVWTRELIDAAISVGGAYYLPYQPHGTPEQFHAAYPRSHELFALKAKVDPQFRLRNVLWDKYYAPTVTTEPAPPPAPHSDFHAVFQDVALHDGFFRFLQTIYRLYPEDPLHALIKDACERFTSEEDIYRHLQRELPRLKPFMAGWRLARPARKQHKAEMLRQTVQLLGERKRIDGYLEIGASVRYASMPTKRLKVAGRLVLAHGTAAASGEPEPLHDSFADASFDVVACYTGLHHGAPEHVDAFAQSVARVLRPGGVFILREHDVRDERMRAFVALTHTVVNAGQGTSWENNAAERRHFAPLAHWCDVFARAGLRDSGARLAQQHDPSDNLLLSFVKDAAPGD
jgi:FAD/FMN-containing dehydrogenase